MIIISVKSCWDNNKYIITIIIVNICLFELNKFKVRSLLFKLGSISSLLSVRPWLLTHLVVNMGALKHSLFIAYITSIVWCTLDMSVNVGTMYVRRGTIVEVIPQTALLITCGFSIAMHILVVYMLWRHSIDCKSSTFQQELPIVHSFFCLFLMITSILQVGTLNVGLISVKISAAKSTPSLHYKG